MDWVQTNHLDSIQAYVSPVSGLHVLPHILALDVVAFMEYFLHSGISATNISKFLQQ